MGELSFRMVTMVSLNLLSLTSTNLDRRVELSSGVLFISIFPISNLLSEKSETAESHPIGKMKAPSKIKSFTE